jgi:hypothetical protein
MSKSKASMTSSEIASLWTLYMNDSLAKCMLGHMLKHIEDPEIKKVVQSSYDLSSHLLDQLHAIFTEEDFAIPNGFTEQDVNPDAPRLFSDLFCLTYVNNMTQLEMIEHSGSVAMGSRKDIRSLFTQALTDTTAIFNQTCEIALDIGLNVRSPYIDVPKETDYVDSKKYLGDLNPFSDNRPLNAIEITHLYMNTTTNTLGFKLCLAFAQVSPSKEVQDFMLEGKDISQKHIKYFTSTLTKDNIQMPNSSDTSITESTTWTFSDKLMMFHMSLISAAGTGNYATAAAASQRLDISMNYERFSLEIAGYAKSGADLMIKHNWLEQPPGTVNREELARNKNKSN